MGDRAGCRGGQLRMERVLGFGVYGLGTGLSFLVLGVRYGFGFRCEFRFSGLGVGLGFWS